MQRRTNTGNTQPIALRPTAVRTSPPAIPRGPVSQSRLILPSVPALTTASARIPEPAIDSERRAPSISGTRLVEMPPVLAPMPPAEGAPPPLPSPEEIPIFVEAASDDTSEPDVFSIERPRAWLEEVGPHSRDLGPRVASEALVATPEPRGSSIAEPSTPIDADARAPSTSVDALEVAFDGNRRRRRAMVVLVVFLVVVFGALFGTLAWSRL